MVALKRELPLADPLEVNKGAGMGVKGGLCMRRAMRSKRSSRQYGVWWWSWSGWVFQSDYLIEYTC